MTPSLIISCEHAGNQVPGAYRVLFEDVTDTLNSHEGWDPGAWQIATVLSEKLNAPLYGCHTTRLLIEPNRSLDNAQLFSRFSNHLNAEKKQKLIDDYYLPYRNGVEHEISKNGKPVLHISVHSFTPIFHEVEREVDIGLLFDPSRKFEFEICSVMKATLESNMPSHRVRFNEPYLGIDDGFTTYLRTKFDDYSYAGIEVEINQKLISNHEEISRNLIIALKKALHK